MKKQSIESYQVMSVLDDMPLLYRQLMAKKLHAERMANIAAEETAPYHSGMTETDQLKMAYDIGFEQAIKDAGLRDAWNGFKNLVSGRGGVIGKLGPEEAARFAGAPNVGAGKASKALSEAKALRTTNAAASRDAELQRRLMESRKANEAKGIWVRSPATAS